MRLALVALALMVASPAGAVGDPPSLCGKGESTIFTCAIRGRTASLCASSDIGPEKGTMTYRFGKPGAIELAYPDPSVAPTKAFSAAVIDMADAPGDYVSFDRNGTTYKIYSVIHRGSGSSGGIFVSRGKEKVADLKCDHGADGLGTDGWALMYKAQLPKNSDTWLDP